MSWIKKVYKAAFTFNTDRDIPDVGFTKNASNLTAGTLPRARLPAPTTMELGAVKRNTGSAGEFVTGFDADGTILYDTPAAGGGGGGGVDIANGVRFPGKNRALTHLQNFSTDSLAFAANDYLLARVYIPQDTLITSLGIRVNLGAATSAVRILIHDELSDGTPSDVIYESGDISTGTSFAEVFTSASPLPFTLSAGWKWLGFRASNHGGRSIRGIPTAFSPAIGFSNNNTSVGAATALRRNLAYATATPDPYNPTILNSELSDIAAPLILFT